MAQRASQVAKGTRKPPIARAPSSAQALVEAQARGRPQRDLIETIWTLFCSLKFAVVLNVALALAAMLGTIIPQMQPGTQDSAELLQSFLGTARDRYGDLTGIFYWA